MYPSEVSICITWVNFRIVLTEMDDTNTLDQKPSTQVDLTQKTQDLLGQSSMNDVSTNDGAKKKMRKRKYVSFMFL